MSTIKDLNERVAWDEAAAEQERKCIANWLRPLDPALADAVLRCEHWTLNHASRQPVRIP